MQNDKYKELSMQASKEAYSSLLKTMQKSGLENLVLFREENIRYVSALPLIISLRAASDSYAAIVDDSGVRVITSEDEYRRLKDYGSWVEIEKYGSEGLIGKDTLWRGKRNGARCCIEKFFSYVFHDIIARKKSAIIEVIILQ